MARLQQFLSNAGILGTLQTAVVSVSVIVLIAYSFHAGDGHFVLPTVLLAVAVAYASREYLVEYVGVTRHLLNTFAIAMFIAIFVFRKNYGVENLWLRFSVCTLATFYIGCYFLLLSDHRIVRDHQ